MYDNAKICVAGIGAVGGIIAAMLCRKYPENVSLIARGARAEALREKGVVLHSEFYGEVTGMPARVVEQGSSLEVQDYIFISVKNYSLEQIAENLRPCVGENTVIIPAVNGVEAGDRLREMFPQAVVCDAAVYTTTGANPDFSVTQKGSYTHMFIGNKVREERYAEGAKGAYELLKNAGFDARFTEEILKEIWSKFLLNCAFNTLTARYLVTSGDIRKSEKLQEDVFALLSETYQVSRAEGIGLPEDMPQKKFDFIMHTQSEAATSSLRRDVEAKRPAEIDAFSGAILRKAAKAGIPVPVMERYHRELEEIIKSYS